MAPINNSLYVSDNAWRGVYRVMLRYATCLAVFVLLILYLALTVTAGEPSEETRGYWKAVKQSLRQGDCQSVLENLSYIVELNPNDPWIPLHRSMCQSRMSQEGIVSGLSTESFNRLRKLLDEEALKQREHVSQQRIMVIEIQKEQDRWEDQLKVLKQQSPQPIDESGLQEKIDAARDRQVEKALQSVERYQAQGGDILTIPGYGKHPSGVVFPSASGDVLLSKEDIEVEQGRQVEMSEGAMRIDAREMQVNSERNMATAEGDVVINFGEAQLLCDRATLFTDTNDVYAEGRVRFRDGQQTFRGDTLHYNFDTKKGRFLQGTASFPPWHEHGRIIEHIAEGVYDLSPGYVTSCEHEPPHFKFFGSSVRVFSDDEMIRTKNATFFVGNVPIFYFPRLTLADRQMPFYIIPGKRKPWGQYVLTGYRYKSNSDSSLSQRGNLHMDWRNNFGWGFGWDHQFESESAGRALLRTYYNEERNRTVRAKSALPKGADKKRYRLLWRHDWRPTEHANIITNISEFGDASFEKDFLYREEFKIENNDSSFISAVTSYPGFSLTGLIVKRMNRFETVTEIFPNIIIDTSMHRIGESPLFARTTFDFANIQTKTAHSTEDTDVIRADVVQEFNYALRLFNPIEVTPNATVRQAYYTKDIQGGIERPQGKRDVISGQFEMGVDSSLKLFRIFPITSNFLGLDLHQLRHIVTPSISYAYIHEPTVPADILNGSTSLLPANGMGIEIVNKLQTRRPDSEGNLIQVDLARMVIGAPYSFKGSSNSEGGQLGDWSIDIELNPRPWLSISTDWEYPSHFDESLREERIDSWNLDVVMAGGVGRANAANSPQMRNRRNSYNSFGGAGDYQSFEPGPRGGKWRISPGQWYLGMGHRYSHNDKVETVLQFDIGLSDKWQLGTLNRFAWKEVRGGQKRFSRIREWQYILTRDLHDWTAEMVWRVDREFGEEFFFILTLKAFPSLPIEIEESYHQPKSGSQTGPF